MFLILGCACISPTRDCHTMASSFNRLVELISSRPWEHNGKGQETVIYAYGIRNNNKQLTELRWSTCSFELMDELVSVDLEHYCKFISPLGMLGGKNTCFQNFRYDFYPTRSAGHLQAVCKANSHPGDILWKSCSLTSWLFPLKFFINIFSTNKSFHCSSSSVENKSAVGGVFDCNIFFSVEIIISQ